MEENKNKIVSGLKELFTSNLLEPLQEIETHYQALNSAYQKEVENV